MKFSVLLILMQTIFIALFGIFVDYGEHAVPQKTGSGNFTKIEKNEISIYYPSMYYKLNYNYIS